ncbi:MAG: glycosyltransferase family 4 protein [Armatimonadota bacterium]
MSITRQMKPVDALRTVFLSTFVPRECGLATFTADVVQVVETHGVTCKVIAMNRPGQQLAYDKRVIATIQEDRLHDYYAAAELINRGGFDILSVQHEFGIFGGVECEHLTALLDAVNIPIVTTLHTVLRKPWPAMLKNLRAVAERSDVIVVMNGLAIELLEKVYGVDSRKVTMVHHGAPVVPRERQYTIKDDMKLHGRKVISTFGLLSVNKGLEYVVQAMPRIVEDYPEALYLILGQTHPVVKQQDGERYRESLKALARQLGVEEHIRFVDKYLTKPELVDYLLTSDVYLTPYLDMDQVTSGTLAYAMCCGRPLVSTPYLYAQFLLGENRGLLVPPRDPVGIAEACLHLFDNPTLKARMELTNWRYGQTMIWPRVGQEYLKVFRQLAGVKAVPGILAGANRLTPPPAPLS